MKPGYLRQLVDDAIEPHGGKSEREFKGTGTWQLRVPPNKIASVLVLLKQNPAVEFVEYDYIARIQQTPNDPLWSAQSYLNQMQIPQAWDVTTGATNIVVAVIDTGVDVNHPDLKGKFWTNAGEIGTDAAGKDKRTNGSDDDGNGFIDDWQGWNFVANTGNVMDDHGHGTHVAGIIGANSNNGQGIAGISWGARILPIKALDRTGAGTYSQVSEAIIYATDHGAQIINQSLGGPSSSQMLANAIKYAQSHGVLVIGAVGDSGSPNIYYPAALPDVIAVGATDSQNQIAGFSNVGDRVDVVAPGVNIQSTALNGSYAQLSGTSMAAAQVSGVAALLAGQPQFDSPLKIRDALVATALDLGVPGKDRSYGAGLVQAASALTFTGAITVTPTLTPTMTPTPWNTAVSVLAPTALWGTAQTATNCTVTNGTRATDLAFNNLYATCAVATAQTTGSWTMNAIGDVSFSTIGTPVRLDVKFYITGTHTDDTVLLQSYNGTTWTTLETFNATNRLPTAVITRTYTVSSQFTTQTQVNAAQVRFSWTRGGTTTDAITYYWDEVRLNVPNTAQATPTLAARAPTKVPGINDPHVAYNPVTDSCGGCHRSHTAPGIVVRANWPEESVCFVCHTATGNGTNVQPAFTNYTNTTTRFFKHNVAGNNGVHRVTESSGAAFGGASRHVECEDCHQAHEATRDATTGTTKAPMIQPAMNAMSGVDPTWTSTGAPFSFSAMPQAQREYQVCLKCHSSYTTLPMYQPDGWGCTTSGCTTRNYVANGLRKLTSAHASQVLDTRDMAQAFNPYNASYHPVVAQGKNTLAPAGGFVAGWSTTSMVYCSDCHTNATPATGGTGPHGSPRLHLLDGANEYTTVDPTNRTNVALGTGEICFKCHNVTTYAPANNQNATNTRFRDGNNNLHELHSGSGGERAPCYVCHNSHGSDQLRLINFDTGVVTINAGYDSQNAWAWDGTNGYCYIACHGQSHGAGFRYTP